MAALALVALTSAACGGGGGGGGGSGSDEARATALHTLRRATADVASGAALAAVSAGLAAPVTPLNGPLRVSADETAAYQKFLHRCGGCHAVPDPAMHTRAEWPGVVARMAATVRAAGLLPMDPADSGRISAFLSSRGR